MFSISDFWDIGFLFSGRLKLDVHGFGAVVLGHAIWFVMAGAKMWNEPSGDGVTVRRAVSS
jgi:hypothetical protein